MSYIQTVHSHISQGLVYSKVNAFRFLRVMIFSHVIFTIFFIFYFKFSLSHYQSHSILPFVFVFFF